MHRRQHRQELWSTAKKHATASDTAATVRKKTAIPKIFTTPSTIPRIVATSDGPRKNNEKGNNASNGKSKTNNGNNNKNLTLRKVLQSTTTTRSTATATPAARARLSTPTTATSAIRIMAEVSTIAPATATTAPTSPRWWFQ